MGNKFTKALEEAFQGLTNYIRIFPKATVSELTGDFYTRLARNCKLYHVNFYLERNNFQSIATSNGKIMSIGLNSSYCRSQESKDQLNELKTLLEENSFNFDLYFQEAKISNIINQVTNYQVL